VEACKTMTMITTQTKLSHNSHHQPQWLENKVNTVMRPSCCRLCQYYRSEGRNGGHCQKLGVSVASHWASCSLALPPFAPSWEKTLPH